jgi:hypothetical protein
VAEGGTKEYGKLSKNIEGELLDISFANHQDEDSKEGEFTK